MGQDCLIYALCCNGWTEYYHKFSVIYETPSTAVCPGSSDPTEKIFNIFASKDEVYTIY